MRDEPGRLSRFGFTTGTAARIEATTAEMATTPMKARRVWVIRKSLRLLRQARQSDVYLRLLRPVAKTCGACNEFLRVKNNVELAAPGAGLPLHELIFVRVMFGIARSLMTQAQATSRF